MNFEPSCYITRTKRKKSAKHQAELDNISKKLKGLEKKYESNKDKMKPIEVQYEDKLKPFLEVKFKLDNQRYKLEDKRVEILEKYEYEVKNPKYEDPRAD